MQVSGLVENPYCVSAAAAAAAAAQSSHCAVNSAVKPSDRLKVLVIERSL